MNNEEACHFYISNQDKFSVKLQTHLLSNLILILPSDYFCRKFSKITKERAVHSKLKDMATWNGLHFCSLPSNQTVADCSYTHTPDNVPNKMMQPVAIFEESYPYMVKKQTCYTIYKNFALKCVVYIFLIIL